ncbi:TPA: hypothetical protein ACGIK9_002894 [Acinetobacter baumannii]|uniref:hypothetical protein n=1 Tax=Acinetobacter baumannii TaxID=470 RepID=UPI00338E1805
MTTPKTINLDQKALIQASVAQLHSQQLLTQPFLTSSTIQKAVEIGMKLFSIDESISEPAQNQVSVIADTFPKVASQYTETLKKVDAHLLSDLINKYNDKLYGILSLKIGYTQTNFTNKTVDEILVDSKDFIEETKTLLVEEHENLLSLFMRLNSIYTGIEAQLNDITDKARILNEVGLSLCAISNVCEIFASKADEELQTITFLSAERLAYISFVKLTAAQMIELINPVKTQLVRFMDWFAATKHNQNEALQIVDAHKKHLVVADTIAFC